ncbi:hypothetical protein K439DRAFT_1326512, partial [Ramaria rubella]
KHVQNTSARYVAHHGSLLHELFHSFDLIPNRMETILPTQQSPTWKPNIDITIPSDTRDTKVLERESMAKVEVYLDGSCINGKVGAAAVLYRNNMK